MDDEFYDIANQQRWTDEDQVTVLLRYINNQHDDAGFRDYLNQLVEEEREIIRRHTDG